MVKSQPYEFNIEQECRVFNIFSELDQNTEKFSKDMAKAFEIMLNSHSISKSFNFEEITSFGFFHKTFTGQGLFFYAEKVFSPTNTSLMNNALSLYQNVFKNKFFKKNTFKERDPNTISISGYPSGSFKFAVVDLIEPFDFDLFIYDTENNQL